TVAAVALAVAFVHWRGLPARDPINHVVGYTVYGIFFAAVLVGAGHARAKSVISGVLGHPALAFFGTYRYRPCVIHGMLSPVLVEWTPVESWTEAFGSVTAGSLACTITRIAVVTALAMASWHLVEKQFLKLKRYFEYQSPKEEGYKIGKTAHGIH